MLVRETFYYVRHGETDYNKQDRMQGLLDIPLNETGLAQAHAAKHLFDGIEIGSVVCSPLIRARRTAEIICEVVKKPITILNELHECDLGVRDGDLKEQWYHDWKASRIEIEGAETYEQLVARSLGAINRAIAKNPGPVLIVAHGGVYWAIKRHAGLPEDFRLANCLPLRHEPPNEEGGKWTVTDLGTGKNPESLKRVTPTTPHRVG